MQATLAHLQPSLTPAQRSPWKPLPQPAATATGSSAGPSLVIDWPIVPRCHGPESDPPGSDQPGLSAAEVAFFKAHGYIVKRRLIPAADLAPFVDQFWNEIVPPSVDRRDKRTWVDPGAHPHWGPNAEQTARKKSAGTAVNRGWPVDYSKDSNINWTEVGGQPAFVDATSAHPDVLRMVEALIGGPLKRPHRNRGMKVPFPRAEVGAQSFGPHSDTMPAELFGMVCPLGRGPR
jgi:hypothetical protein